MSGPGAGLAAGSGAAAPPAAAGASVATGDGEPSLAASPVAFSCRTGAACADGSAPMAVATPLPAPAAPRPGGREDGRAAAVAGAGAAGLGGRSEKLLPDVFAAGSKPGRAGPCRAAAARPELPGLATFGGGSAAAPTCPRSGGANGAGVAAAEGTSLPGWGPVPPSAARAEAANSVQLASPGGPAGSGLSGVPAGPLAREGRSAGGTGGGVGAGAGSGGVAGGWAAPPASLPELPGRLRPVCAAGLVDATGLVDEAGRSAAGEASVPAASRAGGSCGGPALPSLSRGVCRARVSASPKPGPCGAPGTRGCEPPVWAAEAGGEAAATVGGMFDIESAGARGGPARNPRHTGPDGRGCGRKCRARTVAAAIRAGWAVAANASGTGWWRWHGLCAGRSQQVQEFPPCRFSTR